MDEIRSQRVHKREKNPREPSVKGERDGSVQQSLHPLRGLDSEFREVIVPVWVFRGAVRE